MRTKEDEDARNGVPALVLMRVPARWESIFVDSDETSVVYYGRCCYFRERFTIEYVLLS